MDSDLVPVVFFIFLGAIILLPRYLRFRERQKLMETVRLAYERGQPAPTELIAQMARLDGQSTSPGLVDAAVNGRARAPGRDRDLRRGAMLIAVAIAIALFGGALSFTDAAGAGSWPLVGIAAFPGLIGVAFVALWLIDRRRDV